MGGLRQRRPAQHGLACAALGEVPNATDRAEASRRVGDVIDRLQPLAPKVAELLEAAEEGLLAFFAFPSSDWSKLRSTNLARACEPRDRPPRRCRRDLP